MSQYGPPGGMGNDPYGQPEGQWPANGVPNQPPYQGGPGYGPVPGGEQDPFGGRLPDPGGPGMPPPGAGTDPFAQPPFSGQPGPAQPPYGNPAEPPSPPGGFGPPPTDVGQQPWGGPPPPSKKSHAGMIVTIIVIVVVLLGGGGAGWYFLLGPGKSDSGKKDDKQASGPATGVKAGDCVVHPKGSQTVRPASCSKSGALKVYKRFNNTTDKKKCPSPQTDFIYVYTANSGKGDFVLCLQSLESAPAASASASPTA